MDVTAERIKEARDALGWTMEQLGERVGLVKASIHKYESGDIKKFSVEQMKLFASALGVDVSWLLGLSDEKRPKPAQMGASGDQTWIPVLARIVKGEPIYDARNIREHMSIRKNADIHFGLVAKDDSMMESCIRQGSVVLCQESDKVHDGKIAVLFLDGGEAIMRRVYCHDGIAVIRAANPKIPDIVLTKSEHHRMKIIGHAVMVAISLEE